MLTFFALWQSLTVSKTVEHRMLFFGQFSRNWLEKPRKEKCPRQDNSPKINSLMSIFTAD